MEIKVMGVGSAKGAIRRRPRIRITGLWLEEIGFTYFKVMTADYEKGKITLRLRETEHYQGLKKELKASSGLFQVVPNVANKKHVPAIEIKGLWLENIGFTIGSLIAVRYEYGFMQILLIDLDKLAV